MTENLISLLRLLPTGDNAQQFRYKVSADTIQVYHEEKWAKHHFNQSNVASLLTLGMIVEVISKYAEDNNIQVKLEYTANFLQDHLWLTASFSNSVNQPVATEKNQEHLQLLTERKTFRGFFKKIPFDFGAINKKYAGQVLFLEKLKSETYKLIFQMENMVFDNYLAFKDIEKWIRYTDQEITSTKTGMSLVNLNIDPLHGAIAKLMGRSNFLSKVFAGHFKLLNFLKVNALYRQSVGFGLVLMDGTDDQAVIRAGRSILKVWLDLTKQGMALQPISSVSLLPFIYNHRNGQFLKSYEPKLKSAEDTLKAQFQYSGGPGIWLFRFGVPDKTVNKKNQRSLRLETKDLIIK